MFDGFFPQALHDVLYKNILLGFLPLIPVTQESTLLLQTIESHVADSRGRGVLPYMGYIGTCRCEGYGLQAVYSRIGYINQRVWV